MAMITVRAPAKLNLYLHITGKRADGYHLLESLVAFADVADEITIAAAEALSLTIDGEFADAAGAGDGNLVLRSARLLQQKTGVTHGASLHLTNNSPVGAGLGGGSADAAAVLRGLNDWWQLNVSNETLQQWASELGADVAMCLASTPALARGIGDELTPIGALPACYALLVHPRIPLLTADVYAAYALLRHPELVSGSKREMLKHVQHDGAGTLNQWIDWLKNNRNDLQAPAIAVSPLVAEVLLALETLMPKPALVRMTGSGACCFALYANEEEAKRASETLTVEYPFWWVKLARIAS